MTFREETTDREEASKCKTPEDLEQSSDKSLDRGSEINFASINDKPPGLTRLDLPEHPTVKESQYKTLKMPTKLTPLKKTQHIPKYSDFMTNQSSLTSTAGQIAAALNEPPIFAGG